MSQFATLIFLISFSLISYAVPRAPQRPQASVINALTGFNKALNSLRPPLQSCSVPTAPIRSFASGANNTSTSGGGSASSVPGGGSGLSPNLAPAGSSPGADASGFFSPNSAGGAFPPGQIEKEVACAFQGGDAQRVQDFGIAFGKWWNELAARGLKPPSAVDRRHFYAQLKHESGNLKHMSEIGDGSPSVEGGSLYKGRGPLQVTHRANYNKLRIALNKFSAGAKAEQLFSLSEGGGEFESDAGGDPHNIMSDPESAMGNGAKDNFVIAAFSAIHWWENNKIRRQTFREALEKDSDGDVETVSKTVNGGTNGLSERKKFFQEVGSCVSEFIGS